MVDEGSEARPLGEALLRARRLCRKWCLCAAFRCSSWFFLKGGLLKTELICETFFPVSIQPTSFIHQKKYGHAQVPIGWKQNVQLSNWVSTQVRAFVDFMLNDHHKSGSGSFAFKSLCYYGICTLMTSVRSFSSPHLTASGIQAPAEGTQHPSHPGAH